MTTPEIEGTPILPGDMDPVSIKLLSRSGISLWEQVAERSDEELRAIGQVGSTRLMRIRDAQRRRLRAVRERARYVVVGQEGHTVAVDPPPEDGQHEVTVVRVGDDVSVWTSEAAAREYAQSQRERGANVSVLVDQPVEPGLLAVGVILYGGGGS